MRTNKRSTPLKACSSYVPSEIIINILSRLPVDSVLQCRLVCKTWRNLIIHDRSFANTHLDRNAPPAAAGDGKLGFVVFLKKQLCYFEYDDNDEQSCKKIKRFILYPLAGMSFRIVGSCNGLICISIAINIRYGSDLAYKHDPVYICNPITREYVDLPIFTINRDLRGCRLVSGFGYCPFTNEYKVVRIYYSKRKPLVGQVQVYTLGGGSGWRNKDEIMYKLKDTSPGILANGVLHWLDMERKIVALDLSDENFQLLPSPPFTSGDCQLQVLRGQLCCVAYARESHDSFGLDIWSLKKNENCNDNMKDQEHHKLWIWSRDFCMRGQPRSYQPLYLTESGHHLFGFAQFERSFSRFDTETQTSQKLADIASLYYGDHPVPHLNSFVSLKTLGEEYEETYPTKKSEN